VTKEFLHLVNSKNHLGSAIGLVLPYYESESENIDQIDEDEFEEFEGIIGNLTILEKSINSSIQNKDLVEKIKGYDKSIFLMTKKLSTKISLSKVFNKSDLDNRTNELIADFVKRWWA
jgi:hypothetical protein